MNNEEKILQVLGEMNSSLTNIETRLDKVDERLNKIEDDISTLKEDVSTLKEDSAITREACNTLVEWTDHASAVVQVPYPYKNA